MAGAKLPPDGTYLLNFGLGVGGFLPHRLLKLFDLPLGLQLLQVPLPLHLVQSLTKQKMSHFTL